MNDQVEVVDKEQLLKWLEDEFRRYPAEHLGNYGAGQDMLDMIANKVESGIFDHNPSVPITKPGDKEGLPQAIIDAYSKKEVIIHFEGKRYRLRQDVVSLERLEATQ